MRSGTYWRWTHGCVPAEVVVLVVCIWTSGLLTSCNEQYNLTSFTSPLLEYCLTDSVRATCPSGEVIMTESARFGRMELGKCVSRNYGHLGCSSDVLLQVDKQCSGRHSCDFSVSDSSLVRTAPCPKDFSSYLRFSYTCVKVATLPPLWCHSPRALRLHNHTGYLASITTEEHGCGSRENPWIIQVQQGQRVNFTLYDFNASVYNETTDASLHPDSRRMNTGDLSLTRLAHCPQYAIISEEQGERSNVICGGNTRTKHIYLSTSNEVTVKIMNTNSNPGNNFVIKYEVIGCTNLNVPPTMYARRDGDETTVVCNSTGATSVLTCAGRGWEGHIKNCSKSAGIAGGRGASEGGIDVGLPPLGFSIIIILGVALVVVVYVAIMIIIVMYLQRRRRRMQAESNSKVTVPYPCEDLQLDKTHQGNDEHVPMLSRSAVLLRRGVADYAVSGGELHEAGSIGHLLSGRETAFNTDVHSVVTADTCGGQGGGQCDCIAALQPVLSHYATRESMRTYDSPARNPTLARTTARYVPMGNTNTIYGELPRGVAPVVVQGDNGGTFNNPVAAQNSQNQQNPPTSPPSGAAGENLPDPDLVTVTLYSANSNGPKRGNNNSVKTDNECNSLREQRASTFTVKS